MPTTKFDYKKQFPDLYNPEKKPCIIRVPPMNFFMIDGKGDPNTSQIYANAISTLYNCAYTLKMAYKKKATGRDYVVPPLEGLWYMDNMKDWSMKNKEMWNWTMMIRIPDFIPKKEIDLALDTVKSKKTEKVPLINSIRVNLYDEGECVQTLYIGPYDEETSTISQLHSYAQELGYVLSGKHHEIYLSDPRRMSAEKLRTIIRQPLQKFKK